MAPILNDNSGQAYGEDVIEGVGITVGAMQAVARRQLAGSVVVAIIVAAFAVMAALRPGHYDAAYTTARALPGVQQPILVTPSDHVVAAAKRGVEVP
jgi:hypothetical protein